MISILLVSFFLESIISNFIFLSTNLLAPLFVLTALVVVFPYFNSEKEYFKMCILFGFLYDVVFSNTLFINIGLFLIVGSITKMLNYYLSNNIMNSILILFVNIVIYRVCFYFILVFANILTFDFLYLLKSIYSSILLNFIYISILYTIIRLSIRKKQYYKL